MTTSSDAPEGMAKPSALLMPVRSSASFQRSHREAPHLVAGATEALTSRPEGSSGDRVRTQPDLR